MTHHHQEDTHDRHPHARQRRVPLVTRALAAGVRDAVLATWLECSARWHAARAQHHRAALHRIGCSTRALGARAAAATSPAVRP